MDTVEPGRGVRPVVRDGVVSSSGDTILGADNKASLAAILEGVRAVLEAGVPRPDLEVLFTWGEERAHLGARLLDTSGLKARLCILPDVEAPIGTIVTRAPAYWSLRARFHGRAAHAGANPEAGINALVAATRAVARMPLGQVDAETTANVGLFRSGSYRNAVPALAELEAEVRSLDPSRAAARTEAMAEIMREEAERIGATLQAGDSAGVSFLQPVPGCPRHRSGEPRAGEIGGPRDAVQQLQRQRRQRVQQHGPAGSRAGNWHARHPLGRRAHLHREPGAALTRRRGGGRGGGRLTLAGGPRPVPSLYRLGVYDMADPIHLRHVRLRNPGAARQGRQAWLIDWVTVEGRRPDLR